MDSVTVLLNGTLRLTSEQQGMVFPIVDGLLLLSKGVAFTPGPGGRCVELDTAVDTELFFRHVRELAAASGLFEVDGGGEE
jgi:hypothetical protein